MTNHNQLLNLLISTHLYPVMEWGGQGHSSVSILSWRDSRQRVWLTSSRLSSLLVSRELALSLMLYVPLHIVILCFSFIASPLSFSSSLLYTHFPFMCFPRLTTSSVMKWWLLMWTVLRLMLTSKKLSKVLP